VTAVVGSVAGLVGLGLLVAFCDALRRVDQQRVVRVKHPTDQPYALQDAV
jgi:hypothetical protein